MLTTADIAKHLKIGTHGSTYGGNPLACAVAEAAFDTVNDQTVLDGVKHKEQMFKSKLAEINAKYNVFADIRGKGLLIGAELTEAYQGRAKDFLNAAMAEGLMTLVAGANVIRFTPSLVIPDQDIEQGMARFEAAVKAIVEA
jgi:acetylornithine/N-succinyldiaminopimelate aminotransferase